LSNKITHLLFNILVILFSNIASAQSIVEQDASALLKIIKGKESIVDKVLSNPEKYHLQINFTAVQDSLGKVTMNNYSLYKDKYYYHPASLIKFPLALISLEILTKYQENTSVNLQTPIQSKIM